MRHSYYFTMCLFGRTTHFCGSDMDIFDAAYMPKFATLYWYAE